MSNERFQETVALAIDSFVECATILLVANEQEYNDDLGFTLQKASIIADEIIDLLQPIRLHPLISCIQKALTQVSFSLKFAGTPNWYRYSLVTEVVVNPIGRPVESNVYLPMVRFMIDVLEYERRDILRYTRNMNHPLSASTLDRLILRHNLFANRRAHSNITDQELQDLLIYLRFESGIISYGEGVRTIRGKLRSMGYIVSRNRILVIMNIIDRPGIEYRSREVIARQNYSVRGPLEMFHADANCKLVNWRIYVHGCIDGFSHYIVYCKATGKNDAASVKPIFVDACENLGAYPFHLRTDRGWENRGMWEAVAEHREDYIVKCVFVGPSTRNTRIERLWRTYNCSKMMKFKRLFRHMEAEHGLNRHNVLHLWCLHYVFLPRINAELD